MSISCKYSENRTGKDGKFGATSYCTFQTTPRVHCSPLFHSEELHTVLFHLWFWGLSLTKRMSCLSSQRRTSGPSSDSARKTPRRAMSTADASWSNDVSMCWICVWASAQLVGGTERERETSATERSGEIR